MQDVLVLLRWNHQRLQEELINQQRFQDAAQNARDFLQQLQLLVDDSPDLNSLSPRSIQKFQIFSADETLVDEQCAIFLGIYKYR